MLRVILNFSCTYQNLEDKPIVLQLAQPYILDSMRLLLLDNDDQMYSYEIHVSTNLVDWKTIVRSENERSWQNLKFNPIPVVFIWIVGTRNFHSVSRKILLENSNLGFN